MESARYLVLDAYPNLRNEELQQFVGATVGCWVRTDFCRSEEEAVNLAKEKLEGLWEISGVIESEIVDEGSYKRNNRGGRKLFRQSLIDGFVANIHRVPRETIVASESSPKLDHDKQFELMRIAELLNERGIVSLYSSSDGQWANGVTPEGSDFIPLWPGSDVPSYWLPYWSGYEIYPVTRDELIAILPSFRSLECLVGTGELRSVLTMVHPLALMEAIAKAAGGA